MPMQSILVTFSDLENWVKIKGEIYALYIFTFWRTQLKSVSFHVFFSQGGACFEEGHSQVLCLLHATWLLRVSVLLCLDEGSLGGTRKPALSRRAAH